MKRWLIGIGAVLGVIWIFWGSPSPGNLAILKVEGTLYDSEQTIRQIESLRKNDRVRAVVLRVDSPGGSVGAAQEIYDGVKNLAQVKKVVASMGNVAASGGYYIAAPAHKIYANPGTITGSIGVRMEYVNVEELLRWGKIRQQTLKSGEMKDVGSPTRPLSREEKAFLESLLRKMHRQFKEAVATARSLDIEKVERFADGRVLTGQEALENGLIDALGNIQAAIREAATLAGIEGEPDVFYVRREYDSWWERLMGEARVLIRTGVIPSSLSGFRFAYQF